jgi:hypothetical protein
MPKAALLTLTILVPIVHGLSQSRPTGDQLVRAEAALKVTFSIPKLVYFTGERPSGVLHVKNEGATALVVPRLFYEQGPSISIWKYDNVNNATIYSNIGSSIIVDGEAYAEPYPIEVVAPGETRSFQFPSTLAQENLAPEWMPSRPGSYVFVFLGQSSDPFQLVAPPIEAVAEAKWPETAGGDPQFSPEEEPVRDVYRFVYSLRWQGKSFVCLDAGLNNGRGSTLVQLIGSTDATFQKRCYAESILPITRIEASHDGAKNLTVEYIDGLEVRRTFRVDANLNLLP